MGHHSQRTGVLRVIVSSATASILAGSLGGIGALGLGLATSGVASATPTPPSITTTSLPTGTVGSAYSATLQATGGTPPYSWTASTLPAGLHISSTGKITGTPLTPGTKTVHVTAANHGSNAVAYDSIPKAPTTVTFAVDYEAHGIAEQGNQVALATTSEPLGNVVAHMANFSKVAYTVPVTFNIYSVGTDNAVGALLATDTQTFSIPAAPPATTASVFNITFNFAPQKIILPSKVIYGITFSTGPGPNGSNDGHTPSSGLAIGLSYEPRNVTVGSDPLAGTGSDYIDITDANGGTDAGGGYTTNFCGGPGSHDVTQFVYDPGVGGEQPCVGAYALNHRTSPTTPYLPLGSYFIPAVQLNISPATTEKTLPLTIAPGPPETIQPNKLTVTPGTLTLTCTSRPGGPYASGDVTKQTTAKACTKITLGKVKLNEKRQIVTTKGDPLIISTARGSATNSWALYAVMIPSSNTLTDDPFCAGVQGFCNVTTTTSTTEIHHHLQNTSITPNYLGVSGQKCAPNSVPTTTYFNDNPTPTATAGVAPGAIGLSVQTKLCSTKVGSAGGQFFVTTLGYTLVVPPNVYAGTYYGTVQYTLSETAAVIPPNPVTPPQ